MYRVLILVALVLVACVTAGPPHPRRLPHRRRGHPAPFVHPVRVNASVPKETTGSVSGLPFAGAGKNRPAPVLGANNTKGHEGHEGHEGDGDGHSGVDYCSLEECRCRLGELVPLYLYTDADSYQLITVNQNDPDILTDPFTQSKILAYVFPTPVSSTSSVQRYLYETEPYYNYYSTDTYTASGYSFTGIEFYIDEDVRCSAQLPLMVYYDGDEYSGYQFYSLQTFSDGQVPDYYFAFQLGFVFPPSIARSGPGVGDDSHSHHGDKKEV